MTTRLLPLLLLSCSGALPGPGRPGSIDADADGWTPSDGDCDDADPSSFPAALDLPLDGVDQDCDGADALALSARSLAVGDLVITEIMPDPLAVGAEFGEWFEVENRLAVPVDLEGVLAHDLGRDDFLVATSAVIEAGGRAVLGVSDDPERNGGVSVLYRYEADFGLTNAEDAVVLEVGGFVIDEVAWGPGWPIEDGVALSLDAGADAVANDDPAAWCEATEVYGVAGRGTPGAENPACPEPFVGLTALELQPGDLVITELMVDPVAVEGDLGEWVELLNRTGQAVDLQGLTLHDDAGDAFEVPERLVVSPGGRAVIAASADPALNGGIPADAGWRFDFGLSNGGQDVVVAVGTRELDRVTYDGGIAFPDPEGAAISLDPAAEDAALNDDGGRWCVAVTPYGQGDLGTPGAPNPSCL